MRGHTRVCVCTCTHMLLIYQTVGYRNAHNIILLCSVIYSTDISIIIIGTLLFLLCVIKSVIVWRKLIMQTEKFSCVLCS